MIPVAPRTGSATRDSLPRRIYYDLARFDWYARGEPVQWQDQLWEPAGGPVAFVTQDLRLLGEFEGVDLWTLADADTIATLYVPVSEGFWLPFRPALEGS